jgi:hypothetical protein
VFLKRKASSFEVEIDLKFFEERKKRSGRK